MPRVERAAKQRSSELAFYDHGTVSLILQESVQAVFLKARANLPKAFGMDSLTALLRSNTDLLICSCSVSCMW